MSSRISGRASLNGTMLGKKKGIVKVGKSILSFEGYHLFQVYEGERLFVKAVVAPVSWWRRLLKSDLEFRNGQGAVVARYKNGDSYLLGPDGEAKLEEDAQRGVLSTSCGVVKCRELAEECEFESLPESLYGIVAVAVHQLYLRLLRAG